MQSALLLLCFLLSVTSQTPRSREHLVVIKYQGFKLAVLVASFWRKVSFCSAKGNAYPLLPSTNASAISTTWRNQVVVDACQLRSEEENIRKYVSLGFLTLVTGSKFYCGPPFCGAVLFPPAALAELEAGHEHLPAGFEDYFTRHEV